jgi:transposase-like protein
MEMFAGPVEVDETAAGGIEKFKRSHKRKSKGSGGDHNLGKSILIGILNRTNGDVKSKVKADMIFDIAGKTLRGTIRDSVKEQSTVYTDALSGYRRIAETHKHEYVDHAEIYVQGLVHTNGIENFWALLKRCLKGTYIAVQPFHLKRYADEMVYRFNNREGNDADRFNRALKMTFGKRLKYEQLIKSYEGYYDRILPKVA